VFVAVVALMACSKDCPIFYMRKKVQKDLNDQQKTVDRFGGDW
jgi:DNA polymerase delta subunit 1